MPHLPSRKAAPLAMVLALWAGPASADDSSAAIGIGALRFEHAAHIAMQREDLVLLPDEVRVTYEMRNETRAPIRVHVAFPLPALQLGGYAQTPVQALGRIALPKIVNFALEVDGHPVRAAMRVWATLDGKDITATLKQAGVDVRSAPLDGGELSPETVAALKRAGAIGDWGSPDWAVNIAYEWDQTFRPGVTRISHRYTPILGLGELPNPSYKLTDYEAAVCPDASRAPAFLRDVKSHSSAKSPEVATLQFILKTAANWDGPIGTFHLTIRTNHPYASAYMCPGGFALHRAGNGDIDTTATGWHPDRDLTVLYLPETKSTCTQECGPATADWP